MDHNYEIMTDTDEGNMSHGPLLAHDMSRPSTATTSLANESKEEKVEVRNLFLIKHITESDGDLSVIGTFVQSIFNLNDTEQPMLVEDLSEGFFFEYRMNDLTADEDSGWVKTRRAEITKHTGRKTFQVNAPLETETQYDRFPFKTVCASVMIELSSSASADQRRRPTLLLHRSDRGQNVALQKPLTLNMKGMDKTQVAEEFMKKMDKSESYDLITPYPEVTYLYDTKKGYCPKFKVSFYMVESGIGKFIEIVFPMFLIAFMNTLQVLGEKADSSDFLANASTFALTAVVILPSIVSKKRLEVVWCLNNLYVMAIFIGLSLSSIPEAVFNTDIPSKVGMIITWLSFLAPFYGCIGYVMYRRDLKNKSPKYGDRIPSGKGNDRAELITVKDIAEGTIETTTGELIQYKYNDFGKFIEVHA